MSETTVPMDDKALFESATSEAAPETPAVAEEAKPEQDAGQPRDEQGRFAPKAETQAPAVEAKSVEQPKPVQAPAPAETRQEPPPGWIPAWRAREMVEAARAQQPKPQPQEPLDPYLEPEKFRDHGVKQAVDPIRGEIATQREYYSRKDAIRTHGQETVANAYKWLEQGMSNGDQRMLPIYQRAMSSIDPYEEVVMAYKRDKTLAMVGDDPNAWFEKELERRKSDPEFAAKHLTPAQQPNGAQPTSIVKLPPSLNRQPGAASSQAPGTLSDADLYAHAIGR